MLGENYNCKFIDNINFLVFDIVKYKNILHTGNKELINKYAHLIIFDCDEKELELLSSYNEMVKEIGTMIKEYNKKDNIFSFMTDQESYERLYRSQLKTAKDKARKEGLEQGLEQNKLDTVLKMLKKKYPLSEISDLTGYSQEYLKSIHI